MYELHLICGDFATAGYQSDVCIYGVENHGIQWCREGFMVLDVQLTDCKVRAYRTATDECHDQSTDWIGSDETLQDFLRRTLVVIDHDCKVHSFDVLAHRCDKHVTIVFGDKLDKIVKVERTTIYG